MQENPLLNKVIEGDCLEVMKLIRTNLLTWSYVIYPMGLHKTSGIQSYLCQNYGRNITELLKIMGL